MSKLYICRKKNPLGVTPIRSGSVHVSQLTLWLYCVIIHYTDWQVRTCPTTLPRNDSRSWFGDHRTPDGEWGCHAALLAEHCRIQTSVNLVRTRPYPYRSEPRTSQSTALTSRHYFARTWANLAMNQHYFGDSGWKGKQIMIRKLL